MTTRGRALLVLAVGLLVFGRLLGMRELVMAGAAAGVVLGLGVLVLRVRAGNVEVDRRLQPTRTTVGRDVRVELTLNASGRIGTGPLLISDRLPDRLGSGVQLAIASGARRAVAYTLRPRLRGRYDIGPIEITQTDPFGTVQRQRSTPSKSTLTVYPAYEPVSTLPSASPRMGAVRNSPLVGSGDEFYALRAYEEGDDLRKVHWLSALRTGELVIRQDELLAEPRALVILDTCRDKHAGRGQRASIEAAVSACASVAVCALKRRMRVEIVTAEGLLLRKRSPSEHELLESLAVLATSDRPDLTEALRAAPGGRLAVVVAITPGLDTGESNAIALIARRASAGALVAIDARSFAPTSRRRLRSADEIEVPGLTKIGLASGESFGMAWQAGIRDVALAR